MQRTFRVRSSNSGFAPRFASLPAGLFKVSILEYPDFLVPSPKPPVPDLQTGLVAWTVSLILLKLKDIPASFLGRGLGPESQMGWQFSRGSMAGPRGKQALGQATHHRVHGRPRHQTVLGLRLDGALAWSFLVREPLTPLSLFVWEIITSLLHPGVFVKHKIQGPCALRRIVVVRLRKKSKHRGTEEGGEGQGPPVCA